MWFVWGHCQQKAMRCMPVVWRRRLRRRQKIPVAAVCIPEVNLFHLLCVQTSHATSA
jgi:hypothetical protein